MSQPIRQVRTAVARLISFPGTAPEHRRVYRPLVIGPAILRRPMRPTDRWIVAVARTGHLLPLVPRSPFGLQAAMAGLATHGTRARVGMALACPEDASGPTLASCGGTGCQASRSTRFEFYGWSLAWQPPGVAGVAFIDPCDEQDDLPACFELPQELLDRAAHLAARGIRSRPIAIITQPQDFEPLAAGGKNRFLPEAAFRAPCSPDNLY